MTLPELGCSLGSSEDRATAGPARFGSRAL